MKQDQKAFNIVVKHLRKQGCTNCSYSLGGICHNCFSYQGGEHEVETLRNTLIKIAGYRDKWLKEYEDYRTIAYDQELEIQSLKASNQERIDALEIAWGVIANAKNWLDDSDCKSEWVRAAIRWRDRYHKILNEYIKNKNE